MTTGEKRSAQVETEGDGEIVYQCTDVLSQCHAKDIPFMQIAKKIVGYANITDAVDETVNGKEIRKHRGPIIHESEITAKELQ